MTTRNISILISITIILVFGFFFARLHYSEQHEAVIKGTAVIKDIEPDKLLDQERTGVSVKLTACTRVQDRTKLRGIVSNTGMVDLKFVSVRSIWKDREQRVVETGIVYVVQDKPLKPGESIEFEDLSRRANVQKCNADVFDWRI